MAFANPTPIQAPPAIFPSSEQALTDDIIISFGDEPTPAKAAPSITKFEIVNQWIRVQKDFCQVEPLAGAFLEGTTLQRGDFSANPFPLKLVFRADNPFHFDQFTKNSNYPAGLREYLETILQTKVDLNFELPNPPAGSTNAQVNARTSLKTTPAASFERDKEREAILAFLADTFETTWQGTRSLAQPNRKLIQDPSSPMEE